MTKPVKIPLEAPWRHPLRFLGLLTLLTLAGCASVPAAKISTDRIDYGQVIAESWKRQTLLNVVRLRYADAPVFLEVGSIINSYSVASKANAGFELFNRLEPDMFAFGGERTWTNTPTVTYQPLVGDRFTRSLLRPVPPAAVMQLLQGGWPVDLVMQSVVKSLNRLRSDAPGIEAGGDPDYQELLKLLTRIQRLGALDVRVDSRADGGAVVLVIRHAEADSRLEEARRRVLELLDLDNDASEFAIVPGVTPRNRREVAMISRSMLEMMLRLGLGIELPVAHAAEGRALAGRSRAEADPLKIGLARIRSGSEAPADAYTSVFYKNHWYWIDDTDVESKRIFTFLLVLFSLAEAGPGTSAPVVTVPSR